MLLFQNYETVKYVQFRDTRLGMMRFVLLIAIVAYVGIYEMYVKGGYLEASPVIGSVRFSLQQPTVNNCNPNDNNIKDCYNAFVPLEQLDYCSQQRNNNTTTTSAYYNGNIYPCEIYESTNALISQTDTSLVVLTRASIQNQTLVCDGRQRSGLSTNTTCPRTYKNNNDDNNNNNNKFYIAQSEAFTVMFEHAVTASKICTSSSSTSTSYTGGSKGSSYACSAEAYRYDGRLLSDNDELCRLQSRKNNSYDSYRGQNLKSSAPCYIQPNKTTTTNKDFFSIATLLQAAGIAADDCIPDDNDIKSKDNGNSNSSSSSDTTVPLCKTYRDSGATLLLNIVWNDFDESNGKVGLVEPYYYYKVQIIGTSYKQSIPYYQQYRTQRTLLDGHGYKIAVIISGTFHQFDIIHFLITLTTALGLLAVATTVVDSLMLYVLPEKQLYQQYKYEEMQMEMERQHNQEPSLQQQQGHYDVMLPLLPTEQQEEEATTRDPHGWGWWNRQRRPRNRVVPVVAAPSERRNDDDDNSVSSPMASLLQQQEGEEGEEPPNGHEERNADGVQ